MPNKILNSKEIKGLFKMIDKQYGYKLKLDYAFIKRKDKIFAVNKEIFNINLDKIKINSMGLYFGEIIGNEIRLSIELSQFIGANAKKNVIELDKNETIRLFKGEDLEKNADCNGFVILKHKNDFLGTGKVKGNKILNFISKSRRINL